MVNASNQVYTLVTGASKGIGLELAKECASRGMNLILVARTETTLKELAQELKNKYNVEVQYYISDLSKRESAKRVYDWCVENNYLVNTLINNAGIAYFGHFEKLDLENQLSIVDLNINSVVQLTYYFLPMLRKQNKAYILNVASIAALYPLPHYSVYGSSKAFVKSFTQALRFELRDTQISVCCLCPGDTSTEFFKKAGNMKKSDKLMSPEKVAKIGIEGLLKDNPVIFPGQVKIIARIPRPLLNRIVANRTLDYF